MVDTHIKEVAKNVKAYLDAGTSLEDLKAGFAANGGTEVEWEEVLIEIQRQSDTPGKKLSQKLAKAKEKAAAKAEKKKQIAEIKKKKKEQKLANMSPEQKKEVRNNRLFWVFLVVTIGSLVGIRLTLPMFFISPAEIATQKAAALAEIPPEPVIPTLSINPDQLDVRPLIELSKALEEEGENKSDELLHFLNYILTRPNEIKALDALRIYSIKIPLGLKNSVDLYSNETAIKDFKKTLATIQRDQSAFGPTFAETVLQKTFDNYQDDQKLDPTPRFPAIEKMIEDYSKALKKDPMAYQLLLGELHLSTGKPKTAKDILDKAKEQPSADKNYDRILRLSNTIADETNDYLELSEEYVRLLLACKTMSSRKPKNEKCSAMHLTRIGELYESEADFKAAFCGPKPYLTETEGQQIFHFCKDYLSKRSQRLELGGETIRLKRIEQEEGDEE